MNEEHALGTFTHDLAFGRVDFLVIKRPVGTLELQFEEFEVDGRLMPLNQAEELPAGQGYWIDVGTFAAGKEIDVRWRFRTGIQVPDDDIVIGYCPNGRLTRLVRLERRKLEPFRTYVGSFKTMPESP